MKKIPVKRYKYCNEWNGVVSKVQVIKETDHFVFFPDGGRAKKESDSTVYRDTPEEVFEWHKAMLRAEMERKKRTYLHYKEKYDGFIEGGMVCK